VRDLPPDRPAALRPLRHVGPAAYRWPEGPVCGSCVAVVLAELDRCGECGQVAPVLRRGADGRPCCPACCGVRFAWRCAGCGQADRLYCDGRCTACYRDHVIARLLGALCVNIQ